MPELCHVPRTGPSPLEPVLSPEYKTPIPLLPLASVPSVSPGDKKAFFATQEPAGLLACKPEQRLLSLDGAAGAKGWNLPAAGRFLHWCLAGS